MDTLDVVSVLIIVAVPAWILLLYVIIDRQNKTQQERNESPITMKREQHTELPRKNFNDDSTDSLKFA